MKKFIAQSSWSLKAIGFILILSIVFAACGDNGSSAPQDDGASSSVCDESSSSKVKSGSSSKDVMSGDSRDGSSDSKSSSSESGRASSSLFFSDGWSWDVIIRLQLVRLAKPNRVTRNSWNALKRLSAVVNLVMLTAS